MPVLSEVFPAGLEKPADEAEQARQPRLAYEEWRANQQEARRADPAIPQAWVHWVLERTVELPGALLVEGQALPSELKASVTEQGETLRPDLALLNPAGRADAGRAGGNGGTKAAAKVAMPGLFDEEG